MPAKYCDQCGALLQLGHELFCPVFAQQQASKQMFQAQQQANLQNIAQQPASSPVYICIETERGKHYMPYTKKYYQEVFDALRKNHDLQLTKSPADTLILYKHIVSVYIVSASIVAEYRAIQQQLSGED